MVTRTKININIYIQFLDLLYKNLQGKFSLIALLQLVLTISLSAQGIHVAVDGSPQGDGTIERPLNFTTICGNGGGVNHPRVQPGDTIFLHGGTYKGLHWLQLYGLNEAPITVMPYQNERVIFDGNAPGVIGGIPTIKLSGKYIHLVNLEFTNSDLRRISQQPYSKPTDINPRQAIFFDADDSKVINCIFYNNTSGGVLFTEKSVDSELYGNIIFNNGWHGPDRGHGHAMYTRNVEGTKIIEDNICFNSFGRGVHGYGQIVGFKVKGNTSFHAGMASPHGAAHSLSFAGSGASKVIDKLYIEENYIYHNKGAQDGRRVFQVGYIERNKIFVSAINNYVIGGRGLVIEDGFLNQVEENNIETITETKVFIRPNKYERGRANITVFNHDNVDFMDIDISEVVAIGAQYEIKDVQDLFGSPAVSGIYEGGTVRVPLNLTKVTQITGNALVELYHTPKQFNAFLLRSSGNFLTSTSNNPPTIDNIADPAHLQVNAVEQLVQLAGITAGQGENQPLEITAVSSNPLLIPHPTINYNSPETTGTLSFTPVADKIGSAKITVTVDDGQSNNNTKSVTFVVHIDDESGAPAVPDVPTNLTATAVDGGLIKLFWQDNANDEQNYMLERSLSEAGEFIAVTTLAANTTSFIDGILNEPTTYYYRIYATNATGPSAYSNVASATILTVAPPATIATLYLKDAASDDSDEYIKELQDGDSLNINDFGNPFVYLEVLSEPELIGSVQFDINDGAYVYISNKQPHTFFQNGKNWEKSPIPVLGKLKIKLTPYQGANATGSEGEAKVITFTLYQKENAPPTINAIANPAPIFEDAEEQTIKLTGIGAGIGENQFLTFTAISANKNLLSNPTIKYNQGDDFALLSYRPNLNQSGSVLVTVSVFDGGLTNNSTSKNFQITVNPVNDAPTVDPIPDVYLPNTGLEKAVYLTGISAGAPDEQQLITIEVANENPSVLLPPALSYFSPNVIGELKLKAVEGMEGTAVVTITLRDNGAGSPPHENTRIIKFNVLVGDITNADPSFNAFDAPLPIQEDAEMQELTISGINKGKASEIILSAISGNTALIPQPEVKFNEDDGTAKISFKPVANAFGETSLLFMVKDKADETSFSMQQVNIKVISINDAPGLDSIPTIYVLSGTNSYTVNLTGIHTGATNEDQILTVSSTGDNETRISQGNISYTSPQNTGQVVINIKDGLPGIFRYSITVQDNGLNTDPHQNTTTRHFNLVIVDDFAPVVTDIKKDANRIDVIQFSSSDFIEAFEDPRQRKMTTIKIISIPQFGSLSLSGELVRKGDEIRTDLLEYLQYAPTDSFEVADSFLWNASNGLEFAKDHAKVILMGNEGSTFYIKDFYPNPVKEKVTINFFSQTPYDGLAVLHHVNGNMIKELPVQIQAGTNQLILEMDDLKNGVYIVSISHKFKKIHVKLIKMP